MLSRVLYGARLSLMLGLISQSVAVTLGVLLGLLAGHYQRWVDATVMRLADVTQAFPTGIAIGIAVLGFNLVGDALREAFDPRVRSQP